MTVQYIDDHAKESVLIDLRINMSDIQDQLNYLKTIHLLNKEPVLEKLIIKVEFMLEAAKIKVEKDKEDYKLQERTRYEQEYRYAQDQMAMSEQAKRQRDMDMMRYTAGTTTGGMLKQEYDTAGTKIDLPKSLLKGKFDPPF